MRIGTMTAPQPQLTPPASITSALRAAIDAGRADAAGWARIHPTGSTRRFDEDALARVTARPGADAERAELEELHALARSRTDAGVARAQHFAARAGWDEWEAAIADIGVSQGVEQARRAQQLVNEAAGRTHEIVNRGKRQFGRPRPYETDPMLSTVLPRAHGNPAYPSGHTSGAYAAALVLAALVPERAEELIGLADEVGYSRMYGGVHFRSDVVEGARIASAVVHDVLRRHGLA